MVDGGGGAIDFAHKERFHWISMIRLPQFVTREAFHWAVREAERKKGLDCSGVEFFSYEDGLCVQCMHLGPYDGEGRPSGPWSAVRRNRGISWTRANTAATTRSTSVMCGGAGRSG